MSETLSCITSRMPRTSSHPLKSAASPSQTEPIDDTGDQAGPTNMSVTDPFHRCLRQMPDRELEGYIRSLPYNSVQIRAAWKEYSRRWWRSLLHDQWLALLISLFILVSLLAEVTLLIQSRSSRPDVRSHVSAAERFALGKTPAGPNRDQNPRVASTDNVH